MRAPRRVVCAPNAFKGTVSAELAATAMVAGVREAGAGGVAIPVADGGDGTLDVLLAAGGSEATTTRHRVTGPLGRPVDARLGWLAGSTAIVEMAEASGLRLLPADDLAPLLATSRGAGELLAAALDAGAARVIVGVGGSASTDGGAGLLQALGARLLDAHGEEIGAGGGELARLEHVDLSGLHPGISRTVIDVASDVRNPLSGPDGAAFVFAPQKGATSADVAILDAALTRFARIAERDLRAAGLADMAGSGAAGGAGFALALIGATLLSGAALVCDLVGLDAALNGAELALTGEGSLDEQTAFGKAPAEVAARAQRAGVPCAVIAGRVVHPAAGGFVRVISLEEVAGAVEARRDAARLIQQAARQVVEELLGAGPQ
ncbi:MAG TPA: glycerate kinase [Candidatus Dormibacteraeota bacterium]